MGATIRVGMSGFSYPEWVGDFYPDGTKRTGFLAYYSRRLGAVEINMTFRRTPVESTMTKWREAVGDGFRFSLKAHQRITHHRRLVDCADDVAFFVERATGLGDRLGPILFQTPPSLAFEARVLEGFCSSLPAGGTYALEPRHPSFTDDEALGLLARHGVAWCLNDDVFDLTRYRVTGPVAYLRFHRESYSEGDLEDRARLATGIAASGTEVYAFFQHEDSATSVEPALRLQELVGS